MSDESYSLPVCECACCLSVVEDGGISFASDRFAIPDGEQPHEWHELPSGHYISGKVPKLHQVSEGAGQQQKGLWILLIHCWSRGRLDRLHCMFRQLMHCHHFVLWGTLDLVRLQDKLSCMSVLKHNIQAYSGCNCNIPCEAKPAFVHDAVCLDSSTVGTA